jgi:hypothetical protein
VIEELSVRLDTLDGDADLQQVDATRTPGPSLSVLSSTGSR